MLKLFQRSGLITCALSCYKVTRQSFKRGIYYYLVSLYELWFHAHTFNAKNKRQWTNRSWCINPFLCISRIEAAMSFTPSSSSD
ncbi:hypothetical protein EMIT0194MI4_30517 [Pseudomonas sp. IT-194MI4]